MKRSFLCGAVVCALSFAAMAKTDVYFFFDTEDYTCDRSNDAIRDIANLLAAEGVKGNFAVVGFLAARLQELGRKDVIDALRPHVIGSQSMYHTLHPDICELTDLADYRRAHELILAQEAECVGSLKAVFGRDRISFFVPPGNSVTYVGMAACTDLGMTFYGGGGMTDYHPPVSLKSAYGTGGLALSEDRGRGFWYFNMMMLSYSQLFHLETMIPHRGEREIDYDKVLDEMSRRDVLCLYMHPHMAVKTAHWDGINYRFENKVKWREWIPAPDRPAADTALYYERLRAFVRRLKADTRFRISDLDELARELRPRSAIARSDLPAIRTALAKGLGPVGARGSWCVADVFQAAVRFLRGEPAREPGRAWGFLRAPKGVSSETRLAAADLCAAAARIDLGTFLPESFKVGNAEIGPADFLMAALDVLIDGADEVVVTPREQLGSFAEIPTLEAFRIAGHWCHGKDFRDDWLSDRLRFQLWTFRFD